MRPESFENMWVVLSYRSHVNLKNEFETNINGLIASLKTTFILGYRLTKKDDTLLSNNVHSALKI